MEKKINMKVNDTIVLNIVSKGKVVASTMVKLKDIDFFIPKQYDKKIFTKANFILEPII